MSWVTHANQHSTVKEKGGYFEYKLRHFNLSVSDTVIFLLTHVKYLIIINYYL